MRVAAVAAFALGCSAPLRSVEPTPPIANQAAVNTPTPGPRLQLPTLATAGADVCHLGPRVVLGPHSTGTPVLGFDGISGVAAWILGTNLMAVRALARDGHNSGQVDTTEIGDEVEPHAVAPAGGRFVVLLRRWDWQAGHSRWWAVVAERDGRVRKPVQLALDDLDVAEARPLEDGRLALHVGPAIIAKDRSPPRWHVLAVDDSQIAESELAAAPAAPALPEDAIEFRVFNGATPPPPGPGGRIYEAMARPVFERTHGVHPVGSQLDLDAGEPIAHGMHISPDIVWSGTHFLYPFALDNLAQLLPIDCRPG